MTHDPTQTTPNEWRGRFDTFIQSRMSRPFAWGVQDCCLFAADAKLSCTGEDVAADVRGSYSDALGALRVLESIGGIDAAGARFGEECEPLAACIGDVGIVSESSRQMLGVCVGTVWLVPAETGLAVLPLDAASKAWRATCRKL